MNPILRNILAVIAGILVGGLVNGGLIFITDGMISLPEGVDPNDLESIKANIHLYKPENFVVPFLAHALGTLIGAFTAVKIAASHHKMFALVIGVFFLIGGFSMVFMIPNTPTWFMLLDLIGAYLPMGWLGWKLAKNGRTIA